MEVGIRELRNNLSRYLDDVQKGSEIVVTDRGRAVARLQSVDHERRIDRLIAAGVVAPARKPAGSTKLKRVHVAKPIGPLVAEQRR